MKHFALLLSIALLFSGARALFNSATCGGSKTCFVEQDFSRQFSYLLETGNIITIEMQAKNSKWVSTSFSRDMSLGDDDVISCECRYDRLAPDNCSEIVAKDLRLNGRSNLIANEIDPSQSLCILEGEYTSDGDIYCKVQRVITGSGNDSIDADLGLCHYQFYAAGESNRRLDRHVRYEPFMTPLRSVSCVQIKDSIGPNIRTVQVNNCEYWKPHLIINIFAWILVFPIAAFMWHFMVPTLGDDRRTWFIAHRILMFVALVLSIFGCGAFLLYSGQFLSFQYRVIGLWILGDNVILAYQVFTYVLLAFSLSVPFISFGKCSKFKHPEPRFVFDVVYSILLYASVLISTAYILIGLFLTAEMNCYHNSFFQSFYPPGRISRYIMGGWIFSVASIYFLFDIYHVTDERVEKDKQIYQMAAMQDHKLLPDGSLGSTPYPRSEGFYTPTDMPLRNSVFAVFVTVCVIFTLSLTISVGLS